nr:Rho-associated protein kinase [Tanacetum cinerariifolium]
MDDCERIVAIAFVCVIFMFAGLAILDHNAEPVYYLMEAKNMTMMIKRKGLLMGVVIVMALGLSVYLRLWTIDYQISNNEAELLRRQFDIANREAVDESAEWRLRFDEAEERANKCTNELNIIKVSLQDNRAASVTKRLDMLQKENINLLETVEALKQELEAEKLKCNTQKV